MSFLAVLAGGACARELLLTYGLYYSGSWLTTGSGLQYSGQASSTFSLRLRGLLTPQGGLYADMAATRTGIYGRDTSFALQSYSLNVFATRLRSSLLLTWARSRTASLSTAGELVSAGDGLVVNLGLRPLRDVFANLQYIRTRMDTPGTTGTLTSYSSTAYVGAFAVLRPVTLTFTQSWTQSAQAGAGPPSSRSSEARSIGVFLDQPLARGLGLQVRASTGTSRIADTTGVQERTDSTASMRLAAVPARGLIVEGRISYDPRLAPSPLLGAEVRAEPWRMMHLDASFDTGPSYRLWRAALRAFPASRTVIWASASSSEQLADGRVVLQRRGLVSAIVRLSQRADLRVDRFWSETIPSPTRAFQEWSLAYVHRPTSVLTYRLAYRLSDEVQDGLLRVERTLGGDVSWLLSPRASLSLSAQFDLIGGAGLSYSSAWLRWAPDARTDVSLSYRHRRETTGAFSGWSLTVARWLATGTSMQFTFDAQHGGTGDRRSVAVVFQTQLGAR